MKAGDVFWDQHYKYHVVAVVNDHEVRERVVVYRYYKTRNQWWRYWVEPMAAINGRIEAGLISTEGSIK